MVSVDLRRHRRLGADRGHRGAEGPARGERRAGIPVTYVPARNTLFLALALGLAEVLGATDIFIGVNAVDYSGYPDCRPEFIRAFEALAHLATKAGVEGARFSIHAPLSGMTKADIIRTGARLGVDYGLTHCCYDPDAARPGVRAVRQLPAAQEGLPGGGRAGSDAVRDVRDRVLTALAVLVAARDAGTGATLVDATRWCRAWWWTCATRRRTTS